MPTFSPNLEHTLHRAIGEANSRKHEFATLEHLLFGLLDDQDAVAVLRACDVNVRQLRAELKSYLDMELENIISDQGGEASPTAGFQRVIQRSILHVQSSGRRTGSRSQPARWAKRIHSMISAKRAMCPRRKKPRLINIAWILMKKREPAKLTI